MKSSANYIQRILADNWEDYRKKHQVKPYQAREVEKAILCHDKRKGFIPKDGSIQTFGCNSRICSNCGKRYADQWAEKLKSRLLPVPHRHVVLTMPRCLWERFRDWDMLKEYMDAAASTLCDFYSYVMRRKIAPGMIMILHTFGKDLKFNPHLHILITEGGFHDGKYVGCRILKPFSLARKWKYELLCRVTPWYHIHKHYPIGFYVWSSKKLSIPRTSRYVCRYVRHPAIANSRIRRYDAQNITFTYKHHLYGDVRCRMRTEMFISSLIMHIPPRHFKMIRHYGLYARNHY